jgi:demethylmenaquinone methyltransferase/2-methoxy-6-polyprenyl-1,4-benzoquinol methylase
MSEPAAAAGAQLGSGAMFDAIAPRYDLVNRIISLGIDQRWRRETVRALELREGAAVLDLATGTGDLAIQIGRGAPTVSLVGLDPSREMLGICEKKAAAAGLDERLRLEQGTAEELPFEDQSFDAVTMAFGIRNVPDRPAALREISRVLKPGGRVAILELNEPRRGFLAPFARFHVHQVVPRLGALLSRSREYAYLQASIAAFPPPDEFAATMSANRLKVLSVTPMTFGTVCLFVATPAGDTP